VTADEEGKAIGVQRSQTTCAPIVSGLTKYAITLNVL